MADKPKEIFLLEWGDHYEDADGCIAFISKEEGLLYIKENFAHYKDLGNFPFGEETYRCWDNRNEEKWLCLKRVQIYQGSG